MVSLVAVFCFCYFFKYFFSLGPRFQQHYQSLLITPNIQYSGIFMVSQLRPSMQIMGNLREKYEA